MDYQRIYDLFIARYREMESALLQSGAYCETHHIVPKALGGTDDAINKVRVTPEQHYFLHELLARIHGGKLWAALLLMASNHPGGRTLASKRGRILYGIARRKTADAQRAFMAIPENLKKVSGINAPNKSRAARKKLSLSQSKRSMDPVARKKNAERCRARAATEEGRAHLLRISALGNSPAAIAKKSGENSPTKRPEVRRRMSESQRRRYEDPEVRAANAARSTTYWANDENRKRMSKIKSDQMRDPALRNRLSVAATRQFASTSARRAASLRSRRAWENPELKAAAVARGRAQFSTPEARSAAAERTREAFTKPGVREKISGENSPTKRHAVRKKMSAKARRRMQDAAVRENLRAHALRQQEDRRKYVALTGFEGDTRKLKISEVRAHLERVGG